MLLPAPPAPSVVAATLAPVGIAASGPAAPGSALPAPVHATLSVRHADLNVLAGHPSTVSGALRPALAGRIVVLQAIARHGWRTIARTHTGARGRYRLRFVPRGTLSERLRVRFAGDRTSTATRRYAGRLNVYRLAAASWYGGGGGLACGGSLTSSTLGVANKTLPCGTELTLRYGGRSVRVRVIDRGPYVAGREFDLTEATKRALGFGDVGQVWSTR